MCPYPRPGAAVEGHLCGGNKKGPTPECRAFARERLLGEGQLVEEGPIAHAGAGEVDTRRYVAVGVVHAVPGDAVDAGFGHPVDQDTDQFAAHVVDPQSDSAAVRYGVLDGMG